MTDDSSSAAASGADDGTPTDGDAGTEAVAGSDGTPADGADADGGGHEEASGSDVGDADAAGLAWVAVAALVVAVVGLLGVGVVVFDEPLAGNVTELGIGFAWLLAATYVGFRIPGAPRVRLVGAVAFLVAAVAQFVSLVAADAGIRAVRLVAVLLGTVVLLVLVVRSEDAAAGDDD